MRNGRTEASQVRPAIVAGADNAALLGEIDLSVASAARVYEYLLGSSVHFEVDRDAAEHAWGSTPGGVDRGRADLRANRAFLIEAVRYLVATAGIRQFVDVGTLVPSPDNVRGVAQQAVPSCRIVSVSQEPVVLAHAHQLRETTPEGGVADYVHSDLRNPTGIMRQAAATLDLSTQPVALVLVGVLCLRSDEDDPYGVVADYLDAVPAGSYLVMSHFASDVDAEEAAEIGRRLSTAMRESLVPRTHAQVSRFFDGLDVLGPGVVPLNDWRLPETEPIRSGDQTIRYYGGIGRKATDRLRSATVPLTSNRCPGVLGVGERR